MRTVLLIVGWASIVGSIADGLLGLYALWVILNSEVLNFYFSLDEFLKQYVGIIYWMKDLALAIMPKGLALWIFSIPALIYFPVRMIISSIVGWWALNKAKSL